MWNIKPENRFWIGIYGFTAFIMLVAVSVFGWLAWTSHKEPGVGRVAGVLPPRAAAAISDEEYQLLAAFQAPEYAPEPRASEAFQSAMRLYAAQDYKGAVPQLQKITTANTELIGARFYLGICQLLSGDHISGIQALRDVVDAGNTPYLERARFYLAKGLLEEHDFPRAQVQLEQVAAQNGDLKAQASELLTKIKSSSGS